MDWRGQGGGRETGTVSTNQLTEDGLDFGPAGQVLSVKAPTGLLFFHKCCHPFWYKLPSGKYSMFQT